MNGLVIKSPWIENILHAPKTWAMRGSRTNTRGRVALARARSGQILGTCRIVDCIGPMTPDEMRAQAAQQQIPVEGVAASPSAKIYAWVFSDVKAYAQPIPYIHPAGSGVWVKFSAENVTSRFSELEAELKDQVQVQPEAQTQTASGEAPPAAAQPTTPSRENAA